MKKKIKRVEVRLFSKSVLTIETKTITELDEESQKIERTLKELQIAVAEACELSAEDKTEISENVVFLKHQNVTRQGRRQSLTTRKYIQKIKKITENAVLIGGGGDLIYRAIQWLVKIFS
ncbi:MAG TPA: hypothetical protein ENI69_10470 [Rhodospirillales bacterium]|nr:hypothetical protein [Rhodospirillales bacterium]